MRKCSGARVRKCADASVPGVPDTQKRLGNQNLPCAQLAQAPTKAPGYRRAREHEVVATVDSHGLLWRPSISGKGSMDGAEEK